jgi:hypothetical protein
MKFVLFSAAFSLLPLRLVAQNTDSKASIKTYPLDEASVQLIPVATDRVTTVSFPGPITALQGARFTSDSKRLDYLQLSYVPGNYFFSVRALAQNARGNLNVVWNRKTYVIEFVEGNSPVLSANFVYERRGRQSVMNVSPARLLGLLDKAKAYPLLAEHYPRTVEDIAYAMPKVVTEYPDFNVTVDEAFQFTSEDSIVLKVTFTNKTAKPVYYTPSEVQVRVGDYVFPNSISDASGVIPPNASEPGYFVVTGTPSGGRNDLSVKNKFYVIVSENAAPSPSASADDLPRRSLDGRDYKAAASSLFR